jgi:hypothetical protein
VCASILSLSLFIVCCVALGLSVVSLFVFDDVNAKV